MIQWHRFVQLFLYDRTFQRSSKNKWSLRLRLEAPKGSQSQHRQSQQHGRVQVCGTRRSDLGARRRRAMPEGSFRWPLPSRRSSLPTPPSAPALWPSRSESVATTPVTRLARHGRWRVRGRPAGSTDPPMIPCLGAHTGRKVEPNNLCYRRGFDSALVLNDCDGDSAVACSQV